MCNQLSKQILLCILIGLFLTITPVYAVSTFKISNYGAGHQIWFEVEDFDERNPDSDQYYPVVDQAGAFGQAITRAGDAGGIIRWTFDISAAGGTGGTWYFWGRVLNPDNRSDFLLVEGHPGDLVIPSGPPFPGGSSAAEFDNEDDRVFEATNIDWDWWGNDEGSDKVLQNGLNTMYIFHRQGNSTVFWDVFLWTDDPDYVPTDEDYQNASVFFPGKATNPSPANEAADVPREVVLSWMPGELAPATNGHKVFFSENFDNVNERIGGITQTASSYTLPERLEFGKTYYWRVDELSTPPDNTIFEGVIWSFTTELFAYPVENIVATASSSDAGKGPENTINGSGLDGSNLLHGNIGVDTMWMSSLLGDQPTWIEYEFDKVYKLHEMWVWNSNESLEQSIGFGCKDVTIEYSADGTDYTTLGTTHEFARAPGTADYAHNTTIDFAGAQAKYVRLTVNSNWGGILNQFGLSEVRFLSIPVQARGPIPLSGATDVELDLSLSFRAGREAASHNVYFSDDRQSVADGTATVTTVSETSHGPLALDLGKTYYWMVEEVNDAETPSSWQGDIWDFTTHEYFVIDDFESYNDLDPADPNSNRIFLTWLDGFDNPAVNGSVVGYNDAPFAERTIVHSGSQSMPFFYDNSVGNSEATMTLSSRRDWTLRGAGELSLWFRGYPGSVGSFTEDPADTFTMTASGTDIWNQADEFHYAFKTLNGGGSIIAKVESVEQTDNWAKCGVMIRETLDAGSKFAAVYITPTNPDGSATNGCRFQARTDTNGSATSDTSVATAEDLAITAPYWVKLERDTTGNFRGYYSSDGTSWQTMVWRQSIIMSPNVYIGLALTSHNASAICEAKFSGVQTTGNVTGQWQSQDIGILSNSAEPMYVAIANSTGSPAIVYHDEPATTQTGSWTEWIIDFQEFTDQGVNLTNVDKISIGLGDKSNPQAGGSGIMYFDDIRLYAPRQISP